MLQKSFLMFLIGSGVLLAMHGLNLLSLQQVWPVFVLALALFCQFAAFQGANRLLSAALLWLGGTLLVCGGVLQVAVLEGWSLMSSLWPWFIVGPTLGLLQVYLFKYRNWLVSVPTVMLGAVALVFLVN